MDGEQHDLGGGGRNHIGGKEKKVQNEGRSQELTQKAERTSIECPDKEGRNARGEYDMGVKVVKFAFTYEYGKITKRVLTRTGVACPGSHDGKKMVMWAIFSRGTGVHRTCREKKRTMADGEGGRSGSINGHYWESNPIDPKKYPRGEGRGQFWEGDSVELTRRGEESTSVNEGWVWQRPRCGRGKTNVDL